MCSGTRESSVGGLSSEDLNNGWVEREVGMLDKAVVNEQVLQKLSDRSASSHLLRRPHWMTIEHHIHANL